MAGASAASGASVAGSTSSAPRHANGVTTTTTIGPLKAYRQVLAAYVAARKAIAETFKNAVNAAKSAYVTALAAATTGAERSTARAAYSLAIAQAAAARSSALIALGNPPVRPS